MELTLDKLASEHMSAMILAMIALSSINGVSWNTLAISAIMTVIAAVLRKTPDEKAAIPSKTSAFKRWCSCMF
jgi:hypothetical protein